MLLKTTTVYFSLLKMIEFYLNGSGAHHHSGGDTAVAQQCTSFSRSRSCFVKRCSHWNTGLTVWKLSSEASKVKACTHTDLWLHTRAKIAVFLRNPWGSTGCLESCHRERALLKGMQKTSQCRKPGLWCFQLLKNRSYFWILYSYTC